MKESNRWYKKGHDLLKDIENSKTEPDRAFIWFLGQHGFVIKFQGKILYIDVILNDITGGGGESRRCYPPPFPPEAARPVDYFFCTHDHLDHLNLETLLPVAAANPQVKFIVPAPLVSLLTGAGISPERVLGAREGERLDVPDHIPVFPVAAAHPGYTADGRGDYSCLGYVIRCGGIAVYHAGDTYAAPRLADTLKALGPINIAILPINGGDWERTAGGIIGNMSALDAVKLGRAVSADMIIPSHYDMMAGNTENPALFAGYMYQFCPEKKYHIFALGERFCYCR
jgi:L-ascorbate metabolism protein UlaG (beta-lactamase superfamily)